VMRAKRDEDALDKVLRGAAAGLVANAKKAPRKRSGAASPPKRPKAKAAKLRSRKAPKRKPASSRQTKLAL
jgi:hypothetical protein